MKEEKDAGLCDLHLNKPESTSVMSLSEEDTDDP